MYRLPGLHICNSVLPLQCIINYYYLLRHTCTPAQQEEKEEEEVVVLSKVSARRYCNYCTTPRNVN